MGFNSKATPTNNTDYKSYGVHFIPLVINKLRGRHINADTHRHTCIHIADKSHL